jgi:HD-GYP domain-containing protein (c-di-GMP phosphodiesterase class II)/GGDEF domain-containing protein
MTALAWTLVALLAVLAAGALAAWRQAQSRSAVAAAAHEAEQRKVAEEQRRLRETLRAREDALQESRTLVERLKRSRAAERAFNRDLRSELARAHARQRHTTPGEDPRSLVLRAAMSLVEAEKGLLLARRDADGDGALDLAASEGFEHDPEHSGIVQRFARRVLARDETVREDAPQAGEDELDDADREIETLVALPLYLQDRFDGVVLLANRPGGFTECDDDLLLALGDHAGAALHGEHLQAEVSLSRRAVVRMLGEASVARDPAQRSEAGEAVIHATWFADRLGLEGAEREALVSAALVRTLGSVGIPERILEKPAALTPEERSIVELRPRIAFDVLRQLPSLQQTAYTVLYQHERYDGRGYPAGIAGDRIPRTSRALAVIDAFLAMTHDRPHRPARLPSAARRELLDHAGTQFDPELALAFVRHAEHEEPHLDGSLSEAIAEALMPDGSSPPLPLPEPLATHVDALTLLGNHRSFHEALGRAGTDADGAGFAVALIELEGVERANRQEGYEAGDRIIQAAARGAQRAAARLGGTAFREGGRVLGALVPAEEGAEGERLARELSTELNFGPPVRIAAEAGLPGEDGEEVARRARAKLAAEARL